MENCQEDFEDPDFFYNVRRYIENELSNLKKSVDAISQMRIEAAYLESDLMLSINAATWEAISDFIGISSMKTLSRDNKDSQ